MARQRPSRISQARLVGDLKLAAKRGDRNALSLALDQMRTLAHSPRSNPLARLVDLLVIKQGDRIAYQKGWKLPRPQPPKPKTDKKDAKARARRRVSATEQPSLFDV